jgi:hypothetical protein
MIRRGALGRGARVPTRALAAAIGAVALLAGGAVPARAQDLRLVHEPPDSLAAGEPWECVVRVARPSDWYGVDLLYRRGDAFTLAPMRDERGAFRATVPGDAVAPPHLEYYVAGRTAAGDFATLPDATPETTPLRVRVAAGGTGLVLLAPLDGEVVDSPTPEIGVLFDPPLADAAACALFLDGEDRTVECERSIDFLLLVPRAPLDAGRHEATAVVFADSAAPRALTWSFLVSARDGAADVAGPAPREDRPARAGGRLGFASASSRWEIGWAVADAEEVGDPFLLPYDETSDIAFDAALDVASADRATALHLDATRDPIYDDAIRGIARLTRGALRLEAGDIYPYLSELSIAWQSGKGALAAHDGRRVAIALLGIRTVEAEVADGFGTYSQFLWGAASTVRWGANRAGVQLALGYDRAGSIPDSTRVTDAQENRVTSLLLGRRLARSVDLVVEVARSTTGLSTDEPIATASDISGDTADESANAARVVLTLGEASASQLLLEVHDYGHDFSSLGSPTIDSGERGAVVDATLRLPAAFRAAARTEVYTDRDLFTPLADGEPIVQASARLDRETRARWGSLSSYLLGRLYRVPYAELPYRNVYGTVGALAQRGRGSLAASVTRARTTSSSSVGTADACADTAGVSADSLLAGTEDEWTLSGTASASRLFGWLTARAGLRWTASRPERACDEDRWTATAEARAAFRGRSVALEYQRIENRKDRTADEEFVEHLVTASLGGSF